MRGLKRTKYDLAPPPLDEPTDAEFNRNGRKSFPRDRASSGMNTAAAAVLTLSQQQKA
jgi:hypothetical protein